MKSSLFTWAGLAVAVTVTGVAVYQFSREHHVKAPTGDRFANLLETKPPKEVTDEVREFITEHQSSTDPEVQNKVTRARITMGYAYARKGDLPEARTVFLAAAAQHKGTEAQDPAFGKLSDQAAYQAVAALQGQGKPKEATAEWLKFIEQRPLSPLVYGAHKRLIQLDESGERHDEFNRALQVAIEKQEAHRKEQIVACGPKIIRHLQILRGQDPDSIAEIKKDAGTQAGGTTLSGMVRGLAKRGIQAEGYKLNRLDFGREKTPFIWLNGDHYVLVLQTNPTTARIYDPALDNETDVILPDLSSAEFAAPILRLK